MTSRAKILAGLLSGGLAGCELERARRERAYLRHVLSAVIGTERISSRDDLIAIKRFLASRVGYHAAFANARRPLLRASARQVLESGWGFCGENGRVAILLLRAGGIPANRLYLDAERWRHVLVEHLWNGRYVIFDAHNDPATVLPDELVAEIQSDRLELFPNRHAGNRYLRAYRINPLRSIALARNLRLPAVLTVALEQPAMIRAAVAGTLAGALLIAGLPSRERHQQVRR